LPPSTATDNKRSVLQRQSQVIEAERLFQQSAIELSLFWRDAGGKPVVPRLEEAPGDFPQARPLAPEQIAEGLRLALERRPEIQRMASQRDQLDIDRQLAANARMPRIDVLAGFTGESGSGAAVRRGPQELKAGLAFEFPFQNRTARGREGAAQARIRQLDLRARFLEDQIQAEVRDAAIAVEAARERLALLAEEVQVSRAVEEAERSRYELGEGTLFILNLREQATADAAIRKALAEADYQRARAAYDYATGALLL
jgi:outer membrane protein TolC